MTINKTVENETVTLAPVGRLDTITSPMLEKEVDALEKNVTTLIFDLKELEYISSAGLRVLLHAHKLMAKRGTMEVCNVNSIIAEIFEVTNFSEILNIR